MPQPFKPREKNADSIEVKVATENAADSQSPDADLKAQPPTGAVASSDKLKRAQDESAESYINQEDSQDEPAEPHNNSENLQEASAQSPPQPGPELPRHPPGANCVAGPCGPRLRKPRRRVGTIAVLISIAPLLLALVSLIADPASVPFFKAKLFDVTTEAEVADLTKAFNANHHMDILEERSRTYSSNQWKEAERDQQELVDNNVQNGAVYEALALNRIENNGVTTEALDLLRKSVALTVPPGEKFHLDILDDSSTLYRATLALLMCEEYKTVLDICKSLPSESAARPDIKLLRALVLREMGQEGQSKALLKELDAQDNTGYKDAGVDYFQALAEMDDSNYLAAETYVARGTKIKRFMQDQALRDLTLGWLLYQQGHYAEALKKTTTKEEEYGGRFMLREHQRRAARLLLRAHIFLKQNEPAKAQEELKAYKDNGYSGTIYIPKVYRSWINDL